MPLNVLYLNPDEEEGNDRLAETLFLALMDERAHFLQSISELNEKDGDELLFAVPLNEVGMNKEYAKLLGLLRKYPNALNGCTAGIVIEGPGELYIRSVATEFAFALNQAGCTLAGQPLVEMPGSLANFQIQAEARSISLEDACQQAIRELGQRIMQAALPKKQQPALLVLHASNQEASKALTLWQETRQRLGENFTVTEFDLSSGTDCDCTISALEQADAVVLLCPNCNDALSANLTAFVNRLTALFPQPCFHNKAVFAIVVSDFSGSDIVARQIISGMNLNNAFLLPGHSALLHTANAPGQDMADPAIGEKLDAFAQAIRTALCAE